MALIDKHKVKRQRLDRICEGECGELLHSLFLCVYIWNAGYTFKYWFLFCFRLQAFFWLWVGTCNFWVCLSNSLWSFHKYLSFLARCYKIQWKSQRDRLHKCVCVCQKGALGPAEAPNFIFEGCLAQKKNVCVCLGWWLRLEFDVSTLLEEWSRETVIKWSTPQSPGIWWSWSWFVCLRWREAQNKKLSFSAFCLLFFTEQSTGICPNSSAAPTL